MLLTMVNNLSDRSSIHLFSYFVLENNSKPLNNVCSSILGITIEVRGCGCADWGFQKEYGPFQKYKDCKRLKISCRKLRSKCNAKIGSSLGNSASAKRCLRKLHPSTKNVKVKDYCKKTCKVCGKPNLHLSKYNSSGFKNFEIL